ncbi:hypothetical protein [Haloactinospora alba]|nr:hypothetical protein [Haloactinospora alba]
MNVALWASVEALRTAVRHPDFTAHVSELRRLADSDSEAYVERVRRDPE